MSSHWLATVCFVSILLSHAWGVTGATSESLSSWLTRAGFCWEATSAHGLGWFGAIVYNWSRQFGLFFASRGLSFFPPSHVRLWHRSHARRLVWLIASRVDNWVILSLVICHYGSSLWGTCWRNLVWLFSKLRVIETTVQGFILAISLLPLPLCFCFFSSSFGFSFLIPLQFVFSLFLKVC